jgi:rhodanese-related sulfurtransferase
MPTPIGLEKLQELISAGVQLVEVLPAEAYAKAHLPDAISLPLGDLGGELNALERTRAVVVYCWDPL